MKVTSLRTASGQTVKLKDAGEYDLFSSTVLREQSYAVVEGEDEADAFARGQHGEGFPLWLCLPNTPLFDRLFAPEKSGRTRDPAPSVWVADFFKEQKGWEYADDVGIVMRWAAYIAHWEAFGIQVNGYWWDPASSFSDGIRGPHMKALEALINEELTEPGESLAEDRHFGPRNLGDNPEFTAVCVRAVAIMHMSEGPIGGKAGVLELPKAEGSSLRRFLFFGTKTVV